MRIFYRELARGARHSMALQRTRREFFASDIRAYRHPYFWAAFLLTEMGHGLQ
jgi:CHAT domain-containing protein